jgi:hypothetical protein
MNIPPPPDPVDAKINKLMAAAPTSQTPNGPPRGVPNTGIPSRSPGSDQAPAVPNQSLMITNRAGAEVPQTGGAGPGGVGVLLRTCSGIRTQAFDWKDWQQRGLQSLHSLRCDAASW